MGLLFVDKLDSSALPALEMEQLLSSGLKTARSEEYKENRRDFPENLRHRCCGAGPEGLWPAIKMTIRRLKVPFDPGVALG